MEHSTVVVSARPYGPIVLALRICFRLRLCIFTARRLKSTLILSAQTHIVFTLNLLNLELSFGKHFAEVVSIDYVMVVWGKLIDRSFSPFRIKKFPSDHVN